MESPDNRTVASFRERGLADTFCQILTEHGIPASVQSHRVKDSFGYLVAVHDAGHVLQAKSLANEFVENPQAPKFQQAAWETGQTYDNIKMPELAFKLSSFVKVPFTSGVLALCIGVFFSFYLGFFNFLIANLSIQPINTLFENHQWWRLFGPNFLHFGIAHIAFNMLWWWILGARLERIFGSFWLFILFVVSSLFANISQLLATGPNFGGMSGVVYALFGFVWWVGVLRPNWGVSLPKPYIVFMLLWLLLGFIEILPVNMANQAHLFGLISGCLMAVVLHLIAKKKQQQR